MDTVRGVDVAEQAVGLVGQAKAKVAEVEGRIDALRQQRLALQAEQAQLAAQLREEPGDVGLLQRADALRRSLEEVDRLTPARAYRDGDSRPRLQLELERARADLESVRRARWTLAERVRNLEAEQEQWGDRLPRVVALTDDLLGAFGPGRFPERYRQAETQLRALRAWAVDLSRSVGSLDNLRARLSDYGSDSWTPPEVRERGIYGDRPESVRSLWHG